MVAGDDNGVQHIINKNLFDLVGRKFPVFHFLSVSPGAALQVHCNQKGHKWVGCPCMYFLHAFYWSDPEINGKNAAISK